MMNKINSHSKNLFSFLSVVVLATTISCNSSEVSPEPEVTYPLLLSSSISHDNEDRTYLLYIPEGYTKSTEWPLVINLHGRGSSNQVQLGYSQFNALADEYKFIIAYPQGLVGTVGGVTGTHWNANFGTGVDDTGFINVLIDEIYANQGINLAKVYAIGMSNGGFMAYTLACDMSDRIAAIASVTGGMSANSLEICSPLRPVPIIEFHGTADEVVPYLGINGLPPTVPDVVNFWVTNNQCDAMEVIEEDLPDINLDDSSTVTVQQYIMCNQASNVVFYTINNGGHSWPGAFPVASLGNTNKDINASTLIWNFLDNHTHPSPKIPGN